MNETEYAKWKIDANRALSGKYTEAESEIILDWFNNIKGSEERYLVGNEAVDAMLTFVAANGKHDLYNSLMSRLFIYAPLILEEYNLSHKQDSSFNI